MNMFSFLWFLFQTNQTKSFFFITKHLFVKKTKQFFFRLKSVWSFLDNRTQPETKKTSLKALGSSEAKQGFWTSFLLMAPLKRFRRWLFGGVFFFAFLFLVSFFVFPLCFLLFFESKDDLVRNFCSSSSQIWEDSTSSTKQRCVTCLLWQAGFAKWIHFCVSLGQCF